MSWYSILPPELVYLEVWAAKLFSVLALLSITPCLALIIFDIILYMYRVILYEIPVVGGRSRGTRRPRAPSLSERPDGRRRAFSFTGVGVGSGSGCQPRSTSGGSGLDQKGEWIWIVQSAKLVSWVILIFFFLLLAWMSWVVAFTPYSVLYWYPFLLCLSFFLRQLVRLT